MKSAALYGLLAAALFGLSAPLAKVVLSFAGPFATAGFLYLGAGLALLLGRVVRPSKTEAPLRRADLPRMFGVIVSGGVVGPVLLMIGLERLGGLTSSLLLNLEAPLTIALAASLFGDHLVRREAVGAALILAAATGLAWQPGALHGGDALGVFAIAGACAAWALDNNLSQGLSLRDPLQVVRTKALPAAGVNLALALLLGERMPSGLALAGALGIGALGYGASIVFHLLAVRELGAARQAALFATAPFIGALAAVPILHEVFRHWDAASGAVMAIGVLLIVHARHGHAHVHEPLAHEHAHVHDEHHQHEHPEPVVAPHSHLHVHEPLHHDHPHTPDAHHRHRH